MADKKISALDAYTPPIATDVLPIVDVTLGATKKITVANLQAYIRAGYVTGLTAYTPPIATDYMPILDVTTGTEKKMLLSVLKAFMSTTVTLTGSANANTLQTQPTGAVDLAISTTKFVIDSIANRSKYGEISFYTSTGEAGTSIAIDTTLLYHALALASPVSGLLSGFTVINGQSNAIASVAENSAGVSYKVTTTGVHNLSAGDIVTHTGLTTRTTYRGKFVVQSTPSATEYIVLGTYLGTDTGFMKRGCGLKAGAGSAGDYRLAYATSFTADSNSTQFKIEVNQNIADADNIACERYFTSADKAGNLVASGLLTLAVGDIVWLSCANITDATNYKILHLNMNLAKL